MPVRIFTCLLLTALASVAQVPPADSRNQTLPGTNTSFPMPSYASREAWEQRKTALRKQILAAAGLYPLPARRPVKAEIFGRIEQNGYSIEKVYLETLPGYFLGGNLYRPRQAQGAAPAVLIPHGHWTYGRLEHQQLSSTPTQGANLARQGFVVFAYDMVGYTDTVQTPHKFGQERAQRAWSFGPLPLQLWNSIRALDFLTALDGVDASRIAVTGASGGGTQTFLLAAVDDRIAAAAPVNMVSGIMQGGCECENQPGLRHDAINVEFAAMLAPKPLLLVSASGDWTRNVPHDEFPAIRRIYALYGRPERVENAHFEAPHNYHQGSREAVYAFFGKHLLGSQAAVKERSGAPLQLQDMLVFFGRPLPAGAADYDGVFARWRELLSGAAPSRERLALALGTEWPARVLAETQGERVALSRAGRGDRVPGLWLRGSKQATLLVDPAGSAAARAGGEAAARVKAGRSLLLLDAFQTGAAVAPRLKQEQHHLTFNRSDDANRVQDVLTALAWLRAEGYSDVELVGAGRAAVWVTLAAALAPEKVRLAAPAAELGDCDAPGIERAGGIAAVRALAGY